MGPSSGFEGGMKFGTCIVVVVAMSMLIGTLLSHRSSAALMAPCRQHGGVVQIASPFLRDVHVVCRDGSVQTP